MQSDQGALPSADEASDIGQARRQGRWILAGSLLLAGGVLATAYALNVLERQDDIALWRSAAESESRIIAAQVRQTLRASDMLLASVQGRLAPPGDTSPERFEALAESRAVHDDLRAREQLSGDVAELFIASARGLVLNSSRDFPPAAAPGGSLDVSGLEFFRELLARPGATFALGVPVRDPGDGAWRIHIARPIRSAGGRLVGVVAAALDARRLADVYQGQAVVGKSLRIFHESGVVVSAWPPESAESIGKNYAEVASMRVFRAGARSAAVERGDLTFDAKSAASLRVVAPTRVGEFPLVVGVRFDESLVLATANQAAKITWALAALLALVLLAAAAAWRAWLQRTARSVAKLREVDQRLRAQQGELQKLAMIAQRTDNAVVLTDRAGRVVWINSGFTRITGYEWPEVAGRSPGSVLQGPRTDPETRARIRRRLAAGDSFREEVLNYRRDGRPYWLSLEIQPMRDARGEIGGHMAIERDITGERAALGNLRLQRSVAELFVRSETLEQALPELLRLIGEHGDWRIVQAWARSGELLDWRAGWQSHGDGAPRFLEGSRTRALAEGQGGPGRAWSGHAVVALPDIGTDPGDPRKSAAMFEGLADSLCVPIFSGGRIHGVLELCGRRLPTDNPALPETLVTVASLLGQFIARRVAEREQRAAAERAERAADAKGRFIATVSHEIRTPLNAVVGMVSLFDDAEVPDALRSQVDVIKDASERLMTVVNDVLDLSRLESGRTQVRCVPFRPQAAVEQVVRIARGLPGARNLEISQAVGEGAARWFAGDEPRILQVLLNLVGNAVKFTPGGSIHVSVDAELRGERGVTIVFSVRDTGTGIPREHQERIFEPFEQSLADGPPRAAGTGLGLAICRRIADLLGGSLVVESAPGAGSTFRFAVPLEPVEAPGPADAVDPGAPAAPQRQRILLAEDTPASQVVARLILERLGHEVAVVGDGEAAVASFAERPYDAVFLDNQMPRMNGIEAARRIRAMGAEGARVPIIGLSAYVQDADRAAAFAGGMSHYLAKPVRLEDVDALLRRIFGGRSRPPGEAS